jgi:hypothetical protein
MLYSEDFGEKVSLAGSYIILFALMIQSIYMYKKKTRIISHVAFKLYALGYVILLFNSIFLDNRDEYFVKIFILIIIIMIERSSRIYVGEC